MGDCSSFLIIKKVDVLTKIGDKVNGVFLHPFVTAEGKKHTQLGTKQGRKGKYTQGREFDEKGNPVKDIDHTDHGRPDTHPDNPHQHTWEPSKTGGTPQRSKLPTKIE